MIPRRIANATRRLGAPKDWDDTKNGACAALSIRDVDGACESAWEPDPAELAKLSRGASVVLRVWGGQPPVALYVEEPPESDDLGATGEFPEDVLNAHDEGALRFAIGSDDSGNVVLEFGKPVAWTAFPRETAIQMARHLLRHAGVKKVEITL